MKLGVGIKRERLGVDEVGETVGERWREIRGDGRWLSWEWHGKKYRN